MVWKESNLLVTTFSAKRLSVLPEDVPPELATPPCNPPKSNEENTLTVLSVACPDPVVPPVT